MPQVDDYVLDGAIDRISAATLYSVCSAIPANVAGIAALTLASVAVDGADFTKADGTGGGRQVTVAQQTSMSITAGGDADYIVLSDATRILYVLDGDGSVLVDGNTITCLAATIRIADPVNV